MPRHLAGVAELTEQQRRAVEAGGDVLVMAGAGTGKTHTLVERVLHFALSANPPVALDRFLIVTFTEAATAELKRRLLAALVERHEASPDDAWLAGQRARLEHAMIGTLHGYCLRLLREHFHELGLDPALHTLDEAEAELLGEQALSAVFEPFYGGTDPLSVEVRDLWTGQFQGDPGAAGRALRKLHQAVRALEDPSAWLQGQDDYWGAEAPDAWRDALVAALPGWAADWLERLTPEGPVAAGSSNPNLKSRLPHLEMLAGLTPTSGTRAVAAAALAMIKEQPDESWPPRQKTKLRAPLKKLFEEAAAFAGWLALDATGADPLVEDWNWSRGRMRVVVELWRRFEAEYSRRKRERSAVDFADQEQFALDLLGRGNSVGGTVVARVERERFDLVLVDECQDLNAAQDAVLRAVSRSAGAGRGTDEAGAGNRFLVGDVKQSIYRFRLADPAIFQRYAREWSGLEGGGRVLTLSENFRSAESVLGFVNGLFPWLLRPELGGVEFGSDAALQFGSRETRSALAGAEARVEVHLRVTGTEPDTDEGGGVGEREREGAPEGGDERSKTEWEARLVAARLRECHDRQLPVWDKQGRELRPVRWSDMAVLLRGKQSRAEDFGKAFADAGVPLQIGAGGFFDRREIRDLRNLVALLENPLQDVPLLGVLRSPLAGLTEMDQLAAIRLVRRRSGTEPGGAPECWWTLLRYFVEAGRGSAGRPVAPAVAGLAEVNGVAAVAGAALPGADVFSDPAVAPAARVAWERAEAFLLRFAAWRQKALRGPVALALEAALDDTGFEAAYRRGPDRVAANANIQRFLELARQFDQRQSGGVAGFLQWLDRQEEADAIPAALPGGTEAVSLLTIHKSKGLEFPVVAVAALGSTFNDRDGTGGEWVLDPELGLAPRIHPPRGRPYPGPTLWLAQRRQRREQLGEELRLLYVALTRAVDRLLLFGTTSAAALTEWNGAEKAGGPPLPVALLESGRSSLAWLGPALASWAGVDWQAAELGSTPYFHWQVWRETESGSTGRAADSPTIPAAAATAVLVPESASYPHRAATREPAKATVTGLRKRYQREAAEEAGRWMIRPSGRAGTGRGTGDEEIDLDLAAPMDVTAVERGLLHHRFLEHVDLARTDSSALLAAELERLVGLGRFTAAEAAALDVVALARFWAGPLGVEIRRRMGEVRRELPFTLRLSVADLEGLGFQPDAGLARDEFVVVQGVIDLVCLGGDSAWVLDFKTDRVPAGVALAEKAAVYAPQLALYGLAVERLFNRRVGAGWLHFLATGDEIDVLALGRHPT